MNDRERDEGKTMVRSSLGRATESVSTKRSSDFRGDERQIVVTRGNVFEWMQLVQVQICNEVV